MSIDPTHPNGGDKWAIACISPDALFTNSGTRIIEEIASLGYAVSAANYRLLSPPEVARIYRHNLGNSEPGRVDGSWLGREVYAIGPSLTLLLNHSEPQADRLLAERKGVSDPRSRRADALRNLSAHSEKSFSHIHTPDTNAQAWRDLEIFFGPETGRRIKSGETYPVAWNRIIALSDRIAPSRESTWIFVKQAILDKCFLMLATDARIWVGTDHQFIDGIDVTTRILSLHQEYPSLSDRIYFRQRQVFAEAVRSLSRDDLEGGVNVHEVTAVIEAAGAIDGPWLRQLVQASLINSVG